MNKENIERDVAGSLIMISLMLVTMDNPFSQISNWLWLAAIVALNLLQSGFSNFCPFEILLRRFGKGSMK